MQLPNKINQGQIDLCIIHNLTKIFGKCHLQQHCLCCWNRWYNSTPFCICSCWILFIHRYKLWNYSIFSSPAVMPAHLYTVIRIYFFCILRWEHYVDFKSTMCVGRLYYVCMSFPASRGSMKRVVIKRGLGVTAENHRTKKSTALRSTKMIYYAVLFTKEVLQIKNWNWT